MTPENVLQFNRCKAPPPPPGDPMKPIYKLVNEHRACHNLIALADLSYLDVKFFDSDIDCELIAAKALPFMGQRVMYNGKVQGIYYPAILAMPFDRTGENWGAAERLCRSACLLKPGILWYVSPLSDNSEVFRYSAGIMTLESTRHLPRGHTLFTFTRKR